MPLIEQSRHKLRALLGHKSPQDRYIEEQRRAGTFCFIHINKCGGTSIEAALGMPKIHDTAQQRREKVGEKRWNAMRKFSVVRSPYDKVCSHYRYRRKTNQTGLAADPISLDDWVARSYGDHDPLYYDQPLMFAPSLFWLTDKNGEIMMDFIARLEQIDSDWPQIQKLIGVTASLPQLNTTRAEEANLLSATSRQIIEERFAVDFDTFGYAKIAEHAAG